MLSRTTHGLDHRMMNPVVFDRETHMVERLGWQHRPQSGDHLVRKLPEPLHAAILTLTDDTSQN
ncbi:hypothetical protein EEB14_39990 [Rhodococcus sp. WS4]|nr:hypothetical protein EEB14_39990 [Rhodococcus sp. WS4]